MPAVITKEQFEKIVAEKSAQELRVKRIERGSGEGHMKLKLRTSRRLYTLYLKDPGVAKALTKSASTKGIKVVKVKKNGNRV